MHPVEELDGESPELDPVVASGQVSVPPQDTTLKRWLYQNDKIRYMVHRQRWLAIARELKRTR